MTAGLDPLAGLDRDLDHDRVSPGTEAACGACATDEERVERLSGALRLVESAEPALRFALFEKSGLAERQELVARMRGKEIAATEGWMIPRLREDIAAYRERIEALRRTLEEPEG